IGASARLVNPEDRKPSKLRPPDPCAMVLFGATGDLARRLVAPALYNMSCAGELPESFALIGVARSEDDVQAWREGLHGALEGFVRDKAGTFNADHIDEAAWARL